MHFYGKTVRARNLKFSGKMALGLLMTQNSEKLEKVAKVTLKSGNADFGALFCHERLRICNETP